MNTDSLHTMTIQTSRSQAERRNPPPRRKACAACARSKRRCDLGIPRCTRCMGRGILCEYASGSVDSSEFNPDSTPRRNELDPPIGLPTPDDSIFLPDSLSDYRGWELPVADGVDTINAAPEDLPYDGFSPTTPAAEASEWTLESFSTTLVAHRQDEMDYFSTLVKTRLQYSLDTIRNAPMQFVTDTATPWSHAELYKEGMPSAIRDAHAACALYIAKTPVNAPVIMRSIETFAATLVSSRLPTTADDALAHTHALLLYQIIRLFDGDIASRIAAERDIPALETSAVSLLAHVDFASPLHPADNLQLLQPTVFWKRWAFQESARRTMLFSFFFLQIYRMVKAEQQLPCDGKMGLVHSLTLSSHLWHAKSETKFMKAWAERDHFVVLNGGFAEVISGMKAEDIDTYGKIFISTLMGVREADQWLMDRGGSLRDRSPSLSEC